MDCPHCGIENLVGARKCVACGQSTMSAPPPQMPPGPPAPTGSSSDQRQPRESADAQSTHAPQSAQAASNRSTGTAVADSVMALCRLCLDGFEVAPGSTQAAICPRCRGTDSPSGADVVTSAPTILPATQDQPGVDPRAGMAMPRMRPAAKRAELRTGVLVMLWGGALGLVALGFVLARREKDPVADYLAEVKREAAQFVVAPPHGYSTRFESTLNLSLVHEMVRSSFSSKLDPVLQLDQRSVQEADVDWVRDDDAGIVVDSAARCRVTLQTGTASVGDAREARVYPWEGHRGTQRLVIPASGPTQILGGGAPVVGRDVPPFLTLRDVGAPDGGAAPGTTWKTSISLPLLITREGGLYPGTFPCDVTYVGRRVQAGAECWVLSVRGTAPREPQGDIAEMNRTGGTIRAALFFDADSGLLVEARAFADVTTWNERGRIEERLHVSGSIVVQRR